MMIVLVGGCASMEKVENNLSFLTGSNISSVINILGTPSGSIELENKRIYVWENSGSVPINIGGYNQGYDGEGNSISVWDPNQSSFNIATGCKISVHTSKEFIVLYSSAEGNASNCYRLMKAISP